MIEKITSVQKALDRYALLGTKTIPGRVRLIGHVPHVAPEAYIHQIFEPLSEGDIRDLEQAVQSVFPDSLKKFYLVANGINLFSCSLVIYGRRIGAGRTGDDIWQPFSIVIPNTFERPKDAEPHHLLVGSYKWDGSKLVLDTLSGQVAWTPRGTVRAVKTWPSFMDMLSQETSRLDSLFDGQGRKLDHDKPTTPDELS